MSETESARRLAAAKATVDNGFSRVGPGLKDGGAVDAALAGGAAALVRLSDALVLLCKHQHAGEALPLLGSLAGIALAMRWLASAREAECARALREERLDWDWRRMSREPRWRERLERAGVDEERRKPLEDVLAGRALAPSGAAGLPWAHVLPAGPAGPSPAEVLGAAVVAMGHALKALDARWPGAFPGAEQFWRDP